VSLWGFSHENSQSRNAKYSCISYSNIAILYPMTQLFGKEKGEWDFHSSVRRWALLELETVA
jgi:hypothetical protein